VAAIVSGAPTETIIVLTGGRHICICVRTHSVTGHDTGLTPWNRVRFEEQIVAQLKKYPARIYITVKITLLWDDTDILKEHTASFVRVEE
jgi:hypothetical protein